MPYRSDYSRGFNSSSKRTDAYTTVPPRRPETYVYSSSFESRRSKSVGETKNAANKWLRPAVPSKPSKPSDNCKYTPPNCGVRNGASNPNNSYVQLKINNLDPSLDCNRLKRIIGKKFEENGINYTEIRVYEAQTTGDSSLAVTAKATVKFPTQKDAQLAISRLQHERIGHKNINITKVYKGTDLDVLGDEVISTFENIPHDKIPLVLFQELFEKRFYKTVGLNELCKLRNIVEVISEENGMKGKFVQLVFKNNGNVENKTEHTAALNQRCSLHCPQTVDGAWAEPETHESLPYVNLSLHVLSQRIHHLLDSHGGVLPLNSIVQCYFAEFNENFNTQELPLIPLEHLISCVTGVQIASSGVNKQVVWQKNRDDETCSNDSSSSNPDYDDLTKQLVQFSKEVKEMLKSYPRTIIPFTKFVPAYHNHFGRQCCVNKYGFLKLIDLLEAIPQIVQIVNDHQCRLITLTHLEQIKRFASDLIKVVKAQPGKRIKLSSFAEEFEKIFERTFNIADYGVCFIDDMLKEIWKEAVEIVDTEDGDKLISIPRKEQTHEEVIRTKAFSKEVVELLRTTPTFEVNFNKFIPIYHHYFNKQCRVGEYGFSKLIELFEAISPETVEIVLNSQNDKLIRLSYQKRLEAIGLRFEHILKSSPSKSYPLKSLSTSYRTAYGCNINFELFNSNDLIDLLSKIPGSWFRLTKKNNKLYITLMDNDEMDNSRKNLPEVKQPKIKILKREVQNSKAMLTVVTHLKNKDDSLMNMSEVGDLLCGFEIPDNLPPPELTPTKFSQEPDLPDSDLIRFSPTESLTTSVGDSIDLMFLLNEDIDTLENPIAPKVETPTQELIFNGTKKQRKRIAANFSMAFN